MSTKSNPRPVGTVMLPTARLAQLHTLAGLREPPITVTELIEEMVSREMEAGTIPDQLPGFTVCVLDHGQGYVPSFIIDDDLDFGFERMRPADALAVAGVLEAAVTPGAASGKSIGTGSDQIKIARVGRGIVITGTRPDHRRSLTPRMALDLARQLRNAADLATKATAAKI